MVKYVVQSHYVENEGVKLFTAVLLPHKSGKFPTVIIRTPYVNKFVDMEDNDVLSEYLYGYYEWLKNGYAVVLQHCRGCGKSDGEFICYFNERTDGLSLLRWIREQSFYNGEIFLYGGSYLTSVHYATAPFADDIKGAVFNIQDTERYNIAYTNGFFKKGLHGNGFVENYKLKEGMKKKIFLRLVLFILM